MAEWELFGTDEEITHIPIVGTDYKYLIFTNTEPTTMTGETYYNINFLESTGAKCDILVVGHAKYRNLTDISLNGLYNIRVNDTSSILKSNNSVTYDYNLDNLPATNNAITGTTTTYTIPWVIIRDKSRKGETVPYIPSGLLEYENSDWVVHEELNSKIITLQE